MRFKLFVAVLLTTIAASLAFTAAPSSAYTQAARQAGQKAITNACLLRTGCHNITTYAAQEGNGATTFYFYYFTTYCSTMRGQVWVTSAGRVLQFIAQSAGCSTYYDKFSP